MVVKIEEWPCFYNHYYENQHYYIMFNEIFFYQMSKIPYKTVQAAKTRQRHGTGTDSAFRNPCLEQSCSYVKYVQKPYRKLAKTRTMQGIFAGDFRWNIKISTHGFTKPVPDSRASFRVWTQGFWKPVYESRVIFNIWRHGFEKHEF